MEKSPYPLKKPATLRFSLTTVGEDFQQATTWHLRLAEAKGLSAHTIRHYRETFARLLPFMAERGLRPVDVTAEHLREFLLGFSHLSPATRNRYLRGVKGFFSSLTREGHLLTNPAAGVPMVKEFRKMLPVLSEVQVQALLKAIPTHTWPGRRNYALCVLMLDSGIRISEALGLDLEDVNWAESTLLIRMAKGGKQRLVPFGATAKRALLKWLEARGEIPGQPAIFANQLGERLQREQGYRIIKRYGTKAGIHGVRVSPHSLRYTFAVSWIRSHGDLLTLKRILGHSSWRMVEHYAMQTATDLAEKHRIHSPVDRITRR